MITLSMKKNFTSKTINIIKMLILRFSSKHKELKDADGNLKFIPVELDVDVYHNKGIEYLEKKEYNKAIEMFKKEIECDRDGFIGYWCLGKALAGAIDNKSAIENYEIALRNIRRIAKLYSKDVDERIIESIRKDLKSIKT